MKKRFTSKQVLQKAFCGLALVVLTATLIGCGKNAAPPPSEVVIGVAAPLTGKYAEMGKDLVNAVRMAVDERNVQGGIGNKKVRLEVEDDAASPKDAVTVAHKLTSNPAIIGVVGHMNSGTTLPASTIYGTAGMALVMPVPTNPDITKQGLQNLLRIPITDDKQGPALVAFALDHLKKQKLAVIHNKEAYGEGLATEARKALEGRGAPPVLFEGVGADTTDFRPLIAKIQSVNPDAVFLGGGTAEAALFIKQAREQNLTIPFIMGDGCFDTQLMKIAGTAADGCYVSNIAPTTAPTPKAKVFYEKFEASYGKIVAFAPLGYVAATMLMDGIEKAPDKTRGGVLAILKSPSYTFDSILGRFSFEPNGDSRGQRVFVHEVKNSQFVTVPSDL